MPLIPFATFLAGALLSLLVPVCLLIGLSVWYMLSLTRVPGHPSETVPPVPVGAPSQPVEAGGAPAGASAAGTDERGSRTPPDV